ncbi:hypothetical protein [Arthrobacter sp. U41]
MEVFGDSVPVCEEQVFFPELVGPDQVKGQSDPGAEQGAGL